MNDDMNNEITEESVPAEDKKRPFSDHPVRMRFAAMFPDLDDDALDAGMDELMMQHPETDMTELSLNPLFAVFAKGRGDDITGIYEDCEEFTRLMEEQLTEKLRKRTARSTYSGSARNSGSRCGLSDAQYGLLTEWNREHPEYAMTAREYMAALKN